MNKPLIRSLMFACAASVTLPAQGVMVARKKKQDPQPAATATKADAKAEVDVKALHEKLMKALAEADLSDAERAKVMETIGKALHKARGAAEVHRVRAVDVVGEPVEGEVRVFVVGGDGEGAKRIHVVGHEGGDHVELLRDLPVIGDVFEKRAVKVVEVGDAPTTEGEKQYRVNVVGKGAGEGHAVILEEVCEETCEEGEAPGAKVIHRVIHGEPMEIEIAEPMILELKDLNLKIDDVRRAADGQRKSADQMRARAETLRAAAAHADPRTEEVRDVRVLMGDLDHFVDVSKAVELEKLHEVIAKAHKDGNTFFSISRDDGPAVFEWTGEAPKAVNKDKVKAKGKNKAKAKAEKSDGDMAEAIRELRAEMRELRQMMKQIRKELRDEDEEEQDLMPAPAAAPTAPAFGGFPSAAPAAPAAPAPALGGVLRVAPAAPARARSLGGMPAPAAAPSRGQLK